MSTWQLFFGWPAGQVWPNVVASALTAGLAVGWSHRRLARKLRDHHASLAEHITTTAGFVPQDGDEQS